MRSSLARAAGALLLVATSHAVSGCYLTFECEEVSVTGWQPRSSETTFDARRCEDDRHYEIHCRRNDVYTHPYECICRVDGAETDRVFRDDTFPSTEDGGDTVIALANAACGWRLSH